MNKIDILKTIINLEIEDRGSYQQNVITIELLNFGEKRLCLSNKQLDHLRTIVYNSYKLIFIVFNENNFIWADKNKLDFLIQAFNCSFQYDLIDECKINLTTEKQKPNKQLNNYEDDLISEIEIKTKTSPMDFQLRTSKLAIVNRKYGLFLEPGLGKTKTSLDVASYLFEHKLINKVLIYVPASLITNWNMEIKKHFYAKHSKKVKIISHSDLSLIENTRKRKCAKLDLLKTEKDPKIIKKLNKEISLMKDSEFLLNLEGIASGKTLLIFDEVHHFKKESSIRTKFLLENITQQSRILLLTGTPNPKGVLDLYVYAKILDVINIDYYQYLYKYLVVEKTKYGIKTKYEKKEMVAELLTQLKYKSSWIKKEDVLDLPEKNYLTYYYTLNNEQQLIIDKFLHDDTIQLSNTFSYSEKQLQDSLIRILQVQNGFLLNESKEIIEIENNNKLSLLFELVEELGDTPIIIFCVFTAEADMINKKLQEKGYKSVCRHGKRDRKQADPIDDFMNGEANIIVATTASTGTGFTMIHSNNIIYYSNDFNLVNRIQSEDRIHRIGQTKTCNYYDLLAENTLDDIIYRCIKKRGLNLNDIFKKLMK